MTLPEEFAPKRPKLSKFPIQPAPPIRPRLFPDEARFALRLSLLAGATEFAAWAWLAAHGGRRAVLALAALRLLRPVWARLGTRLPRPAIAFALLFAALFVGAVAPHTPLAIAAAGLPALGDLCASTIGDAVTVERRAAGYAWLDMAQALGAALGLIAGAAFPPHVHLVAGAALIIFSLGIIDLRDRGTPRSAWPFAAWVAAFRTPIGWQLTLAAGVVGLASAEKKNFFSFLPAGWVWHVLGMVVTARMEPWMRNAIWLPRLAALLAVAGRIAGWAPLGLLGLGMMFAAIPAAVVRGAGEMERPIVSSWAWSALITGAALAAVI